MACVSRSKTIRAVIFTHVALLLSQHGFAQRAPVQHRPALDLYVYRRSHTTGETVKLRLSAFNQARIEFTAYPLSLPHLITTSRALNSLPKVIRALDLSQMPIVRQWSYAMGNAYPDQWMEREIETPHLGPGVYLIRARGGGAERRTWLAVTDIALMSKRSRQEVLVYAASANSGQPKPGLLLSLTDAAGLIRRGKTDAAGVWRVRQGEVREGKETNLWIYGEQRGNPAFMLAGAPPPPQRHIVYMFSDRPIYRPGHTLKYRGTVRERLESDVPGGFTYRAYAEHEVGIEIRDATDALVDRRVVRTNSFGTFDGSYQLSSEPPLGRWQLIAIVGGQRTYTGLDVQAYRKPEYTVTVLAAAKYVTGGASIPVTIEGHYFFGQAVTRAAVQYQVQFTPESGGGPTNGGTPEPAFSGQGVLDGHGQLRIDIKTKRLPFNRRLTVTAMVTDLSRRSQQGSGAVLITSGRFHLAAAPEKAVYRAGDRIAVLVTARDYEERPVAARVRVRLTETREDALRRVYKETTARDIVTDASGSGTAEFTSARPGYLELTAEAFDAEDNKILASGNVWIAGDDVAGYDYPNLDLVPDRAHYRPGETATVLVNTSLVTPTSSVRRKPSARRRHRPLGGSDNEENRVYPVAWALVTIQGERLYEHRVIRLTARSSTLRIPLSARYFPSVGLSVAILQDRHVYEQDVRLEVVREEQKLDVKIAADRTRYAPGDDATYTVTTRDYLGQPVAAEVGLTVVDAAVYSVRPDDTLDPEAIFYSGQEIRVHTDFSFSAQYSGGAAQTVPRALNQPEQASPAEAGGIRVRRQFVDTAAWIPSVVTSKEGVASVHFAMPDNLTTWRATARGISLGTAVGAATGDVVTSLPLLVRLSVPRFYVDGDDAVISAMVHNYTDITRDVNVRVEVTGIALQGTADRVVRLPPQGEARLEWPAKIGGSEPGTLAGRRPAPDGTVRIRVIADGGTGGQDAAESTLPIVRDGLAQVYAQTGSLSADRAETRLDLSKIPEDATITVTLAPSLASVTLDALTYLSSYPYGCAEQTMSAFLPDVIVTHALKRLNTGRTVRADLPRWVNEGLQKLYRYQHSDGGWNWWEFDQTDGDMTAYVLWGLVQARDAGFLVDEQRILRGSEALIRMLGDEREWNRRADWVLTVTSARLEAVIKPQVGKQSSPLSELFEHRDRLDTFGLSSLCLALAMAGGDAVKRAAQVAGELEAKASVQGTTAHWPAADGGYTWRGDDAGVTAHALRALLAALPRSPLILPAVRWLIGNRTGVAWQSTRSSAEAVFALAEFMERSGELKPRFHAQIRLDQDAVYQFQWTPERVFDDPIRQVILPARWRGHAALILSKDGPGTLYQTTLISYIIPSAVAKANHNGLAVRRLYHVTAEDPSRADTIASGEDVEVTLEVTADANYRYAIVEEPIPAGCEVAPPDEMYRPWGLSFEAGAGYVRQEVRDNKVVFFFSDVPKGRTTLTYRLHSETPGVYRILPSLASLVYFPEIRGNGAPARARIGER